MPRTVLVSVRRAARTRAGAVAAAALVALAACTGGGGATVTPTPDESPVAVVTESPSASPTPTALTEEEVLAALAPLSVSESFDSASDFSRFFLELYPQMFTGELSAVALFDALSGDSCVFCADSLNSVEETFAAEAVSSGGGFTWPNAADPVAEAKGGLSTDGFWYIEQDFHVAPTETLFADGSEAGSDPGGSGNVTTKLQWNGTHWTVAGVSFEFDGS